MHKISTIQQWPGLLSYRSEAETFMIFYQLSDVGTLQTLVYNSCPPTMEVSLSARWRRTPLDRQRSCPRQPHKGEHNQIAPLSSLAQSQASCLTLDPQNYSLPRSSPEWCPALGPTELEPTMVTPGWWAVLGSKLPVPSCAWCGGGNPTDWSPAGFVVLE